MGLIGLIMGLRGLIQGLKQLDLSLGGHEGWDVQTYGRLEIHPCVLQDIGTWGRCPERLRNCMIFYAVKHWFGVVLNR